MAPYIGPYSEYLADRGYSQLVFWKKTFLVGVFSRWLDQQKIEAGGITVDHEEQFFHCYAKQHLLRGGERIALSEVTCWLRQEGVISLTSIKAAELSEIDKNMLEYTSYLRDERGLAPTTIEVYAGAVRRFLTSIGGQCELELASVRATDITDYIRRLAPKDRTFSAAKDMVTSLRSFFRFAQYRGFIKADLAAAVPSVPGWSMISIPKAMPADCVRKLLDESKTWHTPAGLRNRAILLLLARLGLRAIEVTRLDLDDIDWRQGWLRVHGKGRQERPLPLPYDVGEAIASYLKGGRPQSTSRLVFLRSRAPYDGLKVGGDVGQIVRRAIRRAGIKLDVTGSHQLRHALAVDMLRQGLSLTEIGQMLRHRSPEATRKYAKVDLEGLREVALPWPGELP